MRRFERNSMAGHLSGRSAALLVLALGASAAGTLGAGCAASGVGDPCTPEAVPRCGFAATEVYIETSAVQCRTRVCVVYRLDGHPENLRSEDTNGDGVPGPGCPFDLSRSDCATATDPSTCVDDTSDVAPGAPYPSDSIERVFCSCRCAPSDTNPNLPLCVCGDGYHCSDERFCVPHEADPRFCSADYTTNCSPERCDTATSRCR